MSTYTRPVMLFAVRATFVDPGDCRIEYACPLWLAQADLPTWQVGMVSSSYFTGNLVGTLFTGYLIKRIGFNRSYYLASLIFAAGCVGLGVMVGFWSWMSWRFIAGIGCAMIWVVVESALMCSGTSHNRGRLLAAYMMVYYVGTFLGQLLVSKVSGELMHVLPWVTGMILAGILPLLFTRIINQQTEARSSTSITAMLKLRQARLGVNGCIISGIVLGSLYGLMPLYLKHQGMGNASIGFWMAVLVSAGILGQWPNRPSGG
ncbi:transport protein [Salmonella bongori]|nr:transport protein [Salmonella bongori]